MIYFMSDLHGSLKANGIAEYEEKGTKDDLLFLLGDTCLNLPDRTDFEEYTKNFLCLKNPIALVDGNHENYPWLDSFPEEDWCGGRVHRLTDNIVHLMRGYVYTIDGKTFFAMGGWTSSDKWHERGLWYPAEAPSAEELEFGKKSLAERGNRVDYILTHQYNPCFEDAGKELELRKFCRYIDENIDFKRWFFGHCHEERRVDDKHQIVYHNLFPIE